MLCNKKYVFLSLLIFIFTLTACVNTEGVAEAKEEFNKYQTNNDVALLLYNTIYFDTHTLDLGDVIVDEELNGGVGLVENKLYFTTRKEYGFIFNETYGFQLYECDLFGKNIKLVLKKEMSSLSVSFIDEGVVYIQHHTKDFFIGSTMIIDSYNLKTGEYKEYSRGDELSLNGLRVAKQERNKAIYTCNILKKTIEEEKSSYFEIIDAKTKNKKIIDDDFWQNTIYASTFQKYKFYPRRIDVVDGRILLTYYIKAGQYSHLVFEYDFGTETVMYKMLVFPYDPVIEYITGFTLTNN